MKEAIRHISNRKSAGCDAIAIERLTTGGEEAVKVMTGFVTALEEEDMGDRLEEIGVRANLQEMR